MKIYIHKTTGDIVGERAFVSKDGSISKTNDSDPIHVRYLARLTELYEIETAKSVLKCNLITGPDDYIYREETALLGNLAGTTSSIGVTDFTSITRESLGEDDRVNLTLHELSTLLPLRFRGDAMVDFCFNTMSNMVEVFIPTTGNRHLGATKEIYGWKLSKRR